MKNVFLPNRKGKSNLTFIEKVLLLTAHGVLMIFTYIIIPLRPLRKTTDRISYSTFFNLNKLLKIYLLINEEMQA